MVKPDGGEVEAGSVGVAGCGEGKWLFYGKFLSGCFSDKIDDVIFDYYPS